MLNLFPDISSPEDFSQKFENSILVVDGKVTKISGCDVDEEGEFRCDLLSPGRQERGVLAHRTESSFLAVQPSLVVRDDSTYFINTMARQTYRGGHVLGRTLGVRRLRDTESYPEEAGYREALAVLQILYDEGGVSPSLTFDVGQLLKNNLIYTIDGIVYKPITRGLMVDASATIVKGVSDVYTYNLMGHVLDEISISSFTSEHLPAINMRLESLSKKAI